MKTNNTKENWGFKNIEKASIDKIWVNTKYIVFKPWFDFDKEEFDLEVNLHSKTNAHSQSISKQNFRHELNRL